MGGGAEGDSLYKVPRGLEREGLWAAGARIRLMELVCRCYLGRAGSGSGVLLSPELEEAGLGCHASPSEAQKGEGEACDPRALLHPTPTQLCFLLSPHPEWCWQAGRTVPTQLHSLPAPTPGFLFG